MFAAFCCILFLFLGALSAFCALYFYMFFPASLFLSLRAGMLSIHASFSSFLSFHIAAAVWAHRFAALMSLLCIWGLKSVPILSSMALGIPPDAV
jgi:hypothetical protein